MVFPAGEERSKFSARLAQALGDAGWTSISYAELAREFNARGGGSVVSKPGARKWMVGGSIPSQEKMAVMATWLNVSVAWLRFGERADQPSLPSGFESEDMALLSDIELLPEYQEIKARKMVKFLMEISRHSPRR
jgi:hypothetical protein